MTRNRPLILIVNDDGIDSSGIKLLTTAMHEIGDVFVVAPNINRSGSSHSMTLHEDIFLEKINKDFNYFTCSGTPVDCVKSAVNKILPRIPDLCVSGINHGSNHSINSLYSGTLHGAMEGTIQGVPSIAFSHLNYSEEINLSPFKAIIKRVSLAVLRHGLSDGITLNVNFPNIDFSDIKGVKICQQGTGVWTENFQLIKEEQNRKYYKITGTFRDDKNDINTDSWALENKFISIVPISINCTVPINFTELKYLEYDF
ncbi:MAG: 5'/3'-nucleotidase SurE [Flavobacteriales bacterium]|nr:5'/3'-nucleotidase SurE [Flavobacteriales bacterium]